MHSKGNAYEGGGRTVTPFRAVSLLHSNCHLPMVSLATLFSTHKSIQVFFLLLYDITQQTIIAFLMCATHSFFKLKLTECFLCVGQSLKAIHSLYLI